MKKIKEQGFSKLIFFIFEIFSIISCITCMIFINIENKIFITLLPFGFLLITLLFYKNYKISQLSLYPFVSSLSMHIFNYNPWHNTVSNEQDVYILFTFCLQSDDIFPKKVYDGRDGILCT